MEKWVSIKITSLKFILLECKYYWFTKIARHDQIYIIAKCHSSMEIVLQGFCFGNIEPDYFLL